MVKLNLYRQWRSCHRQNSSASLWPILAHLLFAIIRCFLLLPLIVIFYICPSPRETIRSYVCFKRGYIHIKCFRCGKTPNSQVPNLKFEFCFQYTNKLCLRIFFSRNIFILLCKCQQIVSYVSASGISYCLGASAPSSSVHISKMPVEIMYYK